MDKFDVNDDQKKLKLVMLQETLWKVAWSKYTHTIWSSRLLDRADPFRRAVFDPEEAGDFDLLCANPRAPQVWRIH